MDRTSPPLKQLRLAVQGSGWAPGSATASSTSRSSRCATGSAPSTFLAEHDNASGPVQHLLPADADQRRVHRGARPGGAPAGVPGRPAPVLKVGAAARWRPSCWVDEPRPAALEERATGSPTATSTPCSRPASPEPPPPATPPRPARTSPARSTAGRRAAARDAVPDGHPADRRSVTSSSRSADRRRTRDREHLHPQAGHPQPAIGVRRQAGRGLRVTGLRTQVLAVAVVDRSADELTVLVTDRTVGGVAVGDGVRVRLPVDRPSTWQVSMVWVAGEWRVAEVQASPAARTASMSRSVNR